MSESSSGSGKGPGQGRDQTDVSKDRTPEVPAPSTSTRLGDLDVEAYLNSPERKQQFVTPMFDIIAPRYDAFTRLFSFGMDKGWKQEALDAVKAARSGKRTDAALDLACGTGDFTVALAEQLPNANVTGVDASPRMIDHAAQRMESAAYAAIRNRVRVQVGDMMSLNVADASMDVVMAGYGVRNVPDPQTSVREMARVTKRGATLVTLDFYRPEFSLWRRLLLGYLTVAGNTVGWLWHRDPVVYGYISRSIDHFMSWQSFSALLEREGFEVQRVVRHLGGGIALHVATRR